MAKNFNIGSIVGDAPKKATQRADERQAQVPEASKVLYGGNARGKGRPRKTDGSKGAYFVVDAAQLAKVQQIAKDNGLQIKQVLGKALTLFIDAYEAKHGKVEISDHKDINDLI